MTLKNYINKKLGYCDKKVYETGLKKDEEYIKELRLWISHTMFFGNYFNDYYIVWMDESSINSAEYKNHAYSKKK